jgi:hypothetical protein
VSFSFGFCLIPSFFSSYFVFWLPQLSTMHNVSMWRSLALLAVACLGPSFTFLVRLLLSRPECLCSFVTLVLSVGLLSSGHLKETDIPSYYRYPFFSNPRMFFSTFGCATSLLWHSFVLCSFSVLLDRSSDCVSWCELCSFWFGCAVLTYNDVCFQGAAPVNGYNGPLYDASTTGRFLFGVCVVW